MIRTNVLLTEEQHALLKAQSRLRRQTVGQLVRDAVDGAFLEDPVERRRQVALGAYQEGLISLGRLSEILGLDPVSTRRYLAERGIPLAVQEAAELSADAANA